MPRYELVRIRTSPNFYVQWFEDGHSKRVSTRTGSRDEAEAFLSAFKLESAQHPEGDVSVSAVLDWYLDTRGDAIDKARASYAATRLRAFFGATPAVGCGARLQQRYIDHRRASVTDETIRRELSVLSAALNRAAKWEKIPSAPAMITLPASEAKDRWLTRQEACQIIRRFRSCGPATAHLLLFTRLALYTGARSTAILDMTWDRVDLERGEVDLNPKGRKRSKKRRPLVPLNPDLVRALKAAKAKSTADYVIAWRGEKCGRIIRGFRAHMNAMGLTDVTPHTLRHTFATWAARAGEPLHAIGGVLGQSVISTTAKYAKHQPEAMRRVTRAVRRK